VQRMLNPREFGIVGMEPEFELMVQSLEKEIPILLEGEAGTGKTELGKVSAKVLGRPFFRVDGDQELSVLKIQGWFDPPLVLSKGYNWDSFMRGPLTEAMVQGGIFFFNEVNRAPSETINGVLTALDERLLNIPRLGSIEAKEGFVTIFTANPLDRIGTSPLPQAFFDRCVWIPSHHLPLEDAMEVVRLRTGEEDVRLLRTVCEIVEGSRNHPEVVSGGSVRAAIFMVKLAASYRLMNKNVLESATLSTLARSALFKKIKLRYDSESTEEQVIDDLVRRALGLPTRESKKKRMMPL